LLAAKSRPLSHAIGLAARCPCTSARIDFCLLLSSAEFFGADGCGVSVVLLLLLLGLDSVGNGYLKICFRPGYCSGESMPAKVNAGKRLMARSKRVALVLPIALPWSL
jgi:hypothetical protein